MSNNSKVTPLSEEVRSNDQQQINNTCKNNCDDTLDSNHNLLRRKYESNDTSVGTCFIQKHLDLDLKRSVDDKNVSSYPSFRSIREFSSISQHLTSSSLHSDLPSRLPSPSPKSNVQSIITQSPLHTEVSPSTTTYQIIEDSYTSSNKKGKSRKEKSLNVLCERFINYYKERANGLPLDFQLDQATTELGVEKRRIYDIVNVLESINVVKKRAVSLFTWNGFDHLPETLKQLRLEGLRDATLYLGVQSLSPADKENTCIRDSLKNFSTTLDNKSAPLSGDKREKLLMQLSQKFVQLFLVTQISSFSHDQAVQILIKNQSQSESSERTKIRRLYDIANILSSVNLIQKNHSSDYKKQIRFEWIGTNLCSFSQNIDVPICSSSASSLSTTPDELNTDSQLFVAPQNDNSIAIPLKKRKRPLHTYIEEDSKDSETCTLEKPESEGSKSTNSGAHIPQPPSLMRQRTGLHFQFRSPPSKRNKTNTPACGFRTITSLLPPVPFNLISENILPPSTIPSTTLPQLNLTIGKKPAISPMQSAQPLQNITNKVSTELIVSDKKRTGSLSFKFANSEGKKQDLMKSRVQSFKIGEKISFNMNNIAYSTKTSKRENNGLVVQQKTIINQNSESTTYSQPVIYDVRSLLLEQQQQHQQRTTFPKTLSSHATAHQDNTKLQKPSLN
jgi:hypothetical protein